MVFFVLAFLSGSIPFGYIVGLLKGVNVRERGSGNIGATNVSRVLGKGYGLLVLLLDALKGFIPVFAASHFGLPFGDLLICGALSVVGHCFSPFLGFRGGKGVATSLGAFIFISPPATLISFLIFVVTLLVTRYVSLSSILSVSAFPFAFAVFSSRAPGDLLTVSLVAAVVVVKHRSNISRLLRGEERRFF